MKKIILLMTALVISMGTYAQSDPNLPINSDTTGHQKSEKHRDGYTMKGGQMMCVKDQKMTLLKNDTTLTNGTLVMANGDYVRKGETRQMFKEGQHMDLTGRMVPMTKSNDQVEEDARNRRMYLVIDTIKNKKN
jgi:hypothetical protein